MIEKFNNESAVVQAVLDARKDPTRNEFEVASEILRGNEVHLTPCAVAAIYNAAYTRAAPPDGDDDTAAHPWDLCPEQAERGKAARGKQRSIDKAIMQEVDRLNRLNLTVTHEDRLRRNPGA